MKSHNEHAFTHRLGVDKEFPLNFSITCLAFDALPDLNYIDN